MRYYCEAFPDAVKHVSPSMSMYIEKVARGEIRAPNTALDLGAGNGRNSIALARDFGCETTLVDSDPKMLEGASSNFKKLGLRDPGLVCCRLEDLPSLRDLQQKTYDVVIMSYVLHHVEPTHHQGIIEFCGRHVRGHLLVDVYWNRLRCRVGEFFRLGSTSWYGLSYEELASNLAPHFQIQSDRVQILSTNVVFNLVCGTGTTSPEFLATRKFDYTTIMQIRPRGLRRVGQTVAPLESLDCINRLKEAFPGEWLLTKSKYEKLMAETPSVSGGLKRACCLLIACREHGFPLLLKEFEDLFRIKIRRVLKAAIACNNDLRPFGPEYFTQRIIRLAALPTEVEDMALRTLAQCTAGGLSPTVSAGAAVHVAAHRLGISMSMNDIAKMLRVSPIAIRNRQRGLGLMDGSDRDM